MLGVFERKFLLQNIWHHLHWRRVYVYRRIKVQCLHYVGHVVRMSKDGPAKRSSEAPMEISI